MLGGTAAGDCPLEGLSVKSPLPHLSSQQDGQVISLLLPLPLTEDRSWHALEEGDLSCLRGGGLCNAAKPGHLQRVLLSKTLLLCAGQVCTEVLTVACRGMSSW